MPPALHRGGTPLAVLTLARREEIAPVFAPDARQTSSPTARMSASAFECVTMPSCMR